MTYETIMQMLNGLYQNDPSKDFVTTASNNINKQTKKRVGDLESKYSTTGMGRSGIQGAALNDIYSNSSDALSGVAAKGEEMAYSNKMNTLNSMLKTQELDDQSSPWGMLLGKLLNAGGQMGASALSPAPVYNFVPK